MRGFVLINTTIGEAPNIAKRVRQIPGVTCADLVLGDYDIVAIVDFVDTDALNRLINHKIPDVPGVTRTITMLSVEGDCAEP